jgi:hypothetical protein
VASPDITLGAVTAIIERRVPALMVVGHVMAVKPRLVVAQVTAELPLVFETVAQVPELLALVLIQMAAVLGPRALAVDMAAMALIAEMPLAPRAVTMAMAMVGLLMVVPVSPVLVRAGALDARRQKQNARGQHGRHDTFCPHGTSS